MELGNHAEFLGVMKYTDMLATFFTHDGGETQKWRSQRPCRNEFWKWMASWAVMLRKPSDLGYDDGGYDLPPLNQVQHQVAVDYAPSLETGLLFPMEATTLQERIGARRDTITERVRSPHRSRRPIARSSGGATSMPKAKRWQSHPRRGRDQGQRHRRREGAQAERFQRRQDARAGHKTGRLRVRHELAALRRYRLRRPQ
jgi:hypothetical protein